MGFDVFLEIWQILWLVLTLVTFEVLLEPLFGQVGVGWSDSAVSFQLSHDFLPRHKVVGVERVPVLFVLETD